MPIDNLSQQYPNNPDVTSQINQTSIAQAQLPGYVDSQTPVNQIDPYTQELIAANQAQFAPQAIGPQGRGLYPGLGHDINVGGYSGSIVGSQNIYAPGGNIVPVDPILARRKAIDDAARARAASITPFDPGKPYTLKDARFQKKYEDAYYRRSNELVDQAKEKYGKDFGLVLSDPNTAEGRQFRQEMANFETLGREFDQIVDLIADIDKGLQDKTREYTPETLEIKRDFERLLGSFEEGDVFASQDLGSLYDKLKGHRSFEDYIQSGNFFDDISGITTQYAYDADKGEYYKAGTTERVSFDQAINEVVDSLASTVFAPEVNQGIYDREFMKKAIGARLKDSIKQTGTLIKKDAGRIADEQVATQGQAFDQQREDNNYTYNEDGTLAKDQSGPGSVHYRHDVNLSGRRTTVQERTSTGATKSINVQGIPLTQATFLNGNRQQNFEGDIYSKISGISTITRGNQTYVVANTKSYSPIKVRYKDQAGKRVKVDYDTWRKDKDKGKYTTEVEYKEVEIPVVLTDGQGNETGTFNEIRNNIRNPEAQAQLDRAYQQANQSRVQEQGAAQTQAPQGSDFN